MTGFFGYAATRSSVGKTAIGKFEMPACTPIPSSFTLAYLGDACYELWCRKLVLSRIQNRGRVHRNVVQLVRCRSQSLLVRVLLPLINENEMKVYQKGRNSRPHSVPSYANVAEYRKATGFECLVGYWFLNGEEERFERLMNQDAVRLVIESFLESEEYQGTDAENLKPSLGKGYK